MSYYFNIINRRQVTITDDEEKNYILHPCLSQNQSINKIRENTSFLHNYFAKRSQGLPTTCGGMK